MSSQNLIKFMELKYCTVFRDRTHNFLEMGISIFPCTKSIFECNQYLKLGFEIFLGCRGYMSLSTHQF